MADGDGVDGVGGCVLHHDPLGLRRLEVAVLGVTRRRLEDEPVIVGLVGVEVDVAVYCLGGGD